MKTPRSKAEIAYIRRQLAPILDRLSAADEQVAFLEFSVRRGITDPIDFATRIRKSMRSGRVPSTFTAVLLLEYEAFRNPPRKTVKSGKAARRS